MKRHSVPVALAIMLLPAVAFAGPSEFEALRAKGLLLAYLGVFGAGLLTSLTPCVYPMITITVGIFGAREATSRWRAFGLATMYVLGMVVMFSLLGVVFALSGRMSGAGFLLSNPAIVIPIVVVYVALAASMFGFYELNLPSGLQTKLSGVGGKGTLGAFLMGLVGGLTAAPCTGPMLAGLLAFIATTRSVVLGVTFMTVYACGMGVLFWVIATFAVSLPKSGRWMEIVKAAGGIALLGVGFYFLRPIWPALARLTSASTLFLAIAVGFAVVGAASFAFYLRRSEVPFKIAGIALVTIGIAMIVNWSMTPKTDIAWRHDRDTAIAEAKAAGRPTLIDFSASWCKPCAKFETDIFADPAVHAELADRFMPVKFDMSNDTDADEAAKAAWKAPELPTVIVLGPDGNERARWHEVPSADEFLTKIRAVR